MSNTVEANTKTVQRTVRQSKPVNNIAVQAAWTTTQKIVFAVNAFIITASVLLIAYSYIKYIFHVKHTSTEEVVTYEDKKERVFSDKLFCVDKMLKIRKYHYGQYWILENFVVGELYEKVDCGHYVTYATQIRDLKVFENLPQLAYRWEAPVSVALFAPSSDFELIMNSIQHVRNCGPDSKIVKASVSFHIIIPHNFLPTRIPHDSEINVLPFNCDKSAPYLDKLYEDTFSYKNKLAYPLNILRNIARRAINTHFFISAEAYFLPAQQGSLKFINIMLNKYCIFSNEEVSSCRNIHSQEDIMRQMHLLPKLIRNIETIYLVTIMKAKPNRTIPNTSSAIKFALQRSEVSVVQSREYYFFGDPVVPYYDERIYWTSDFSNQLHPYILCLLDYRLELLSDYALWIYSNQNITNYAATQEFTTTAQYLNKSRLKLEYENIYGTSRIEECQQCYVMDEPCL